MTKLTPRPDQEEKIRLVLAESTHAALIADDMGKGKTLMGAEVVLHLGLPRVLIVGIRDTGKQWAATITGQSDGRTKLRVMNSTKGGEANFTAFMDGEPGIFFAGVQWLTSRDWEVREKLDHNGDPIPVVDKKTGELTGKNETDSYHLALYSRRLANKKRAVDVVIVDEVHKMQNRHSQTAGTITSIKSEWRLGISGTFAGNSFEGAWKVTRWLWPDLVDRSFVRWRKAWCRTVNPLRRNGEILTDARGNAIETITGETIEGAFVATLPCYIRDEPDPVPPPRIVEVELTPRQREQYTSLEKTSMAWLDAHTPFGKEPLIADLPITQRQRLRTATLGEMRFGEDEELTFDVDTPSAKLNSVKYIIDNIWKDQPVLIGCYSQAFARIAAERLKRAGYGAVAWHGGVSPKERESIKERFIARDPSARYLVCTIPSIGTGTDGLQKACSKIIWMEESESRIDNEQFVKRAFRDGMLLDYGPFEHVKLIASETLDAGILQRHDAATVSMSNSLRAA